MIKIIIFIVILCLLGLVILAIFQHKQKVSIDPKYLLKIEQCLKLELNLDDSIKFIECARAFNMQLVELAQQQKTTTHITKLTHELLGLILKVPRISEQNDDDILATIKLISTITQVTEELKVFFRKNIIAFKSSFK